MLFRSVNRESEDDLLLETYHALTEAHQERVNGYLQALRDLGNDKN